MNILEEIIEWAGQAAAGMASHWRLTRSSVDRDMKVSFAVLLVAMGDRKHDSALPGALARVLQELNGLGGIDRVLSGSPLATSRENLPLAAVVDGVLAQLFGGRIDYVESTLSTNGVAGVAESSRMLRQCVLLMAVFLAQHIGARGGCLGDMINRVSQDYDALVACLPARLAAWYGASPEAAPRPPMPPVPQVPSRSVWPWILLLVLIGFAALAVWRTGAGEHAPAFQNLGRTSSVQTTEDQSTGRHEAYDPALGFFGDLILPDETELFVPRLGVENKLIAFVEDGSKAVDENLWFNLDRLTFEPGSNELAPTSDEQLRNIASIMGAFPALRIRVGGYTDNSVTPESARALSGERAQKVVDALVALGVESDRLQATGYGQERPVASNDTPEGRVRNWRVDINVLAK